MATTKSVGRPRNQRPYTNINFHIDVDLLEWIDQTRGDKARTRFINELIRKEAGL